jgi:hypothetical protein
MNTAAGKTERKMLSNLRVKSKSPRQPWTPGPRELSLKQPEKSIFRGNEANQKPVRGFLRSETEREKQRIAGKGEEASCLWTKAEERYHDIMELKA